MLYSCSAAMTGQAIPGVPCQFEERTERKTWITQGNGGKNRPGKNCFTYTVRRRGLIPGKRQRAPREALWIRMTQSLHSVFVAWLG